MKNEKRYYQRIENYYNTTSRNGFYSARMIDLMIVILPVLSIIYAVGFCEPNPDDLILTYVSILMCMSTVGSNFIAHCCAYKCHHLESNWAEAEMTRLNDEQDEKESEPEEGWNTAISVFNNASYACFGISFVLFFILVSL